jgi:hypothetical protein
MRCPSLLNYAATLALLLAVQITARVISRYWALHSPRGEKSLLAMVALYSPSDSCILCYWYRALSYIHYINQHTQPIKQHTIHKIQFMKTASAYTLRCSGGLPEDATPVPKHVGVDTYHELHFMVCILVYFTECISWTIYWIWVEASLIFCRQSMCNGWSCTLRPHYMPSLPADNSA